MRRHNYRDESALYSGHGEARSIRAKLLPYAGHWAGSLAVLPVTAISHTMWGTDPAALPWAAAGMAVTGGALTLLTARAASVRAGITRVHSTLTTALGAAWCTAATIAGPTSHPLIDTWMLGGAAVALSWNIRRVLRNTGDESGGVGAEFFEKVKLAGTRVRGEIGVEPNKVTMRLQVPPGELTASDVSGARERIASGLSVPANAVRVTPDPDHHDRAELVIVPRDMLKKATAWRGPSSPGGSISEPLILGIYEDGEWVRLYLPGDKSQPRNATHLLVMGMNGAGKSHGGKLAWVEILTRSDVVLWVADPAKGKQTLGPVMSGLDWAATSPSSAQQMIDALPAVIAARANWLGEHGLDEWVPGCGIPYLVVWIEEAAELVRDSQTMIDVVQKARSAGVSIVLSLQRPSYRNITTDVRQQLGAVWCFGVKGIEDAGFALGEDLIEAGANPAAWGNKKPGYAYLEAPGLDDDRMVTPLRTLAFSNEEITQFVTSFASVRATLDPITVAAAGDAYANRHQADSEEVVSITTARSAKAHDPFSGYLSDEDDSNPPALPADPEPDLAGDADTDLPELPEMQFGATKPSLQQARTLLGQVLAELHASGLVEVGPRDIPKAFFDQVRSRPWVSAELGRLSDTGALVETDREGVYRFPVTMNAA